MSPFTSWHQVDDLLRGWGGRAWMMLTVAGMLVALASLNGTLDFATYTLMQAVAFLLILGPACVLVWRARRLFLPHP